MTKHIEVSLFRQSILLTILFTILSCLFWGFILVLLLHGHLFSWGERRSPTADITTTFSPTLIEVTAVPSPTLDVTNALRAAVSRTVAEYAYELFLYPVSSRTRLPMDFPRTKAQLPLVNLGEVSVAVIIEEPLNQLMADAKLAGFSPYLRSGFRSIDDQYTAFSRYVTEATTTGMSLKEAQAYAMRFSAKPGYSEHHLGLAVDLLDYFYPDWIIARKNYDKGLYLWLRQHAHEYGFVISYPAGQDPTYAKSGSGYELSEPWHLRFVGKDLAVWIFEAGYLDSQIDITVDEVLREVYLLSSNTLPIQ
jgi:LAS superfamily LD-carboxypeptidase LdcB